jgi:hypothetical protein
MRTLWSHDATRYPRRCIMLCIRTLSCFLFSEVLSSAVFHTEYGGIYKAEKFMGKTWYMCKSR